MSDRKNILAMNEGGNNRRYELIDSVKGITIVLMVMGHCYAPFTHWIFLFHMAVFFLCSGFCWNEAHSKNVRSYGRYVLKQFRMLYIPYLICNAIFLFLNNLFITLGIYTANTDFLMIGVDVSTNSVAVMHSVKGFLIHLFQIILMVGGTQLGGPTWFFGVLFLVCVIFTGICTLFRYYSIARRKLFFLLGLAVVTCFFLVLLRYIEIPIHEFILRDALGFLLYIVGIFIRQIYEQLNNKLKVAAVKGGAGNIICFVMCILMLHQLNKHGSISIATGKYVNIAFLLVCSLTGWGMLLSFSCLLPNKVRQSLEFFGKHTRIIVCLHLLSFKIVTLVTIAVLGLPHMMLAIFPAFEKPEYLWPIYTVVGLALPLLIELCWVKIQNIFMIHIVQE